MDWLLTSNRWKHLVGVFLLSLLGTALMGIGCVGGMEFKDVHHANGDSKPLREWNWGAWDWLDCLAGLLGCIPAIGIHVIIYIVLT